MTTSRDKVTVCPAGESFVVHSEMTKRTSDYMSFSPQNENGCFKKKTKQKWRDSRNIPIHPSAGSHRSSLHWHFDKHCFPYHGYGHTISHWAPIWPASHAEYKSTHSFFYIISAQFKHKMQNLNLDLAKQLKLSNPEETGKRLILKIGLFIIR